MATKKRDKSLSSMAFAAIMGQGSSAEPEQEETVTPAPAEAAVPAETETKPAPQPARQPRAKAAKPEPAPVEPQPAPYVPTYAPVYTEPARRPGRPASKSPKRNYGVSLCIEDYEALKEMAKGSDKSITELLTLMINEYDRNHPELRQKYRKIQELLNS